jgi:hypothetical protein
VSGAPTASSLGEVCRDNVGHEEIGQVGTCVGKVGAACRGAGGERTFGASVL